MPAATTLSVTERPKSRDVRIGKSDNRGKLANQPWQINLARAERFLYFYAAFFQRLPENANAVGGLPRSGD